MASHELRTPLTTILGSAELLARVPSSDPERRARLIAHISDSARALRRTVENLLDASLVESGRLTIRREQMPLGDLLTRCVQTFVGAGAERLVLPEPLAELVVWGDGDKLTQVLTNLVGSALKYSPGGSPVAIAVRRESDAVLITVSDRGLGIAPADLPHIFERYYRAADGRVRVARGAGLGLSISRDIVRAHGGDIAVQSEPGRGSAFTVRLPLQPGEIPDEELDGRIGRSSPALALPALAQAAS